MHISNIRHYNKIPTFTDTHRRVEDTNGNLKYQTTSYLFREDLDWNGLSKLLHEKYIDTQKVNVIMHACSDGSEPYSLVMKLLTDYGKDASKFFKIDARDIDLSNIQYAKSPSLKVSFPSLVALEKYTNGKITDFFEPNIKSLTEDIYFPKKKLLTDNVVFTQSDLVKDIYDFKGNNTVLFARNVWPYIKDCSLKENLIKVLADKMDNTSLFVVGDFDEEDSNFVDFLKNNGLVETTVPHVYQKKNAQNTSYFNPWFM